MDVPARPLPVYAIYLAAALIGSWLLLGVESPWRALWPSVVGLVGVWVLQRVVLSLLAGALAGALLLEGGNPFTAVLSLPTQHLMPAFLSSWNLGAILFTLLLGGFAALLEGGGGLRQLVSARLRDVRHRAVNLQVATVGLGFLCFFDGLANALLIGRVTRSLARPCGVSAAKMAYVADTTSSAVACIAFISTWIATQLSLIRSSLETLGLETAYIPTGLFFASVPYNYYVLTTLGLLVWSVLWQWHPGPMAAAERRAREEAGQVPLEPEPKGSAVKAYQALAPLLLLAIGMVATFYLWEARPLWPVTLPKIALSFSSGDGALLLVLGSLPAVGLALILYPRTAGKPGAWRSFLGGANQMAVPLFILFAAWTIGSVIGDLEAGKAIAQLLEGRLPIGLFPLAVFMTGAIVSFSTGSSWGTMSLLMPIALPVAGTFALAGPDQAMLFAAVVGAVFGGAVFGDHCSPFSDTTIMSSIACGVAPLEHVRTQLPYALIAVGMAMILGYLPLGLGHGGPGLHLLLIAAAILVLPLLFSKARHRA